ncbi:MAG TPA: HAD hydrolase-like protein [Thermoanaerobaculaceae bacterium]|nr:HAD hydrolase-like protein [Thermoanaerobaculaceae bacterium]HRS16986.1 HAD hydrolase-like protein [Thermoanaerobaculaceae bacterium]
MSDGHTGHAYRGEISMGVLLERYEVLLLDSYGVLIHQHGPLPGALALIGTMNAVGKPYFILTNDASRSPQAASRRYHTLGLAIPPERIITAGSLIAPYFAARGLQGARCIVLGPPDSEQYVLEAGGEVIPAEDDAEPDVIVICDESGFPYLETVDAVLTAIFRRLDAGKPLHLVLANPDLIFPRGERSYGLTAGSIALVLEAAMALRYPDGLYPRFEPLGKPHAPIFEEALRRSGSRIMVMIGDQLSTDIKGACDFGIDSALVPTGLTHIGGGGLGEVCPTYVLPTLVRGR